jgi:hypothetical protein
MFGGRNARPHKSYNRGMSAATDQTTRILPSILDAIGDTPIVRLPHVGAGVKPQIVAKVEALNPVG